MRARASTIAVCVAIVATTIVAYSNILSCGFVSFDDEVYVEKNLVILAGLSWSSWWYAWTTFDANNWHPLTWLSLALDGSIWGANPAGYHATNLVLHVLNSLLVFGVLHQMTKSVYRSACVAAFFALHPLHVESVAWISERKDVLSTFFLLFTLIAYVKYAARLSTAWYYLALTLFGLGLLSKPMLVTVPFLLLLLDGWPLNRIDWSASHLEWSENHPLDTRFRPRSIERLLAEKIPFFALAFADGIVTLIAQGEAARDLNVLSQDARIANLFNAFRWYLQKTFLPLNLTIFYPHPEQDWSWGHVAIGAVLVVVTSVYSLWQIKSKPYMVVGWVWFFVSLLPVIGLFQVGTQAYADRYAYVPHIGLFILIVWQAQAWLSVKKAGRVVGGIVVAGALIFCSLLTHAQVAYWKNSETLWRHAIEVVPECGLGNFYYAQALRIAGRHEQAVEHYAKAVGSMRDQSYLVLVDAYCGWGLSLLELNRPIEAEEQFLEALKQDVNHAKSRDELTKLLQLQWQQSEAARSLDPHRVVLTRFSEEETVEPSSDDAKSSNVGVLLARLGRLEQALPFLRNELILNPYSAAGCNNLALALAKLDQRKKAKQLFNRALELDSKLAVAHFNLAEILDEEKDFDGARQHFDKALQLNPDDVEAEQRLNRLSKP